MQIYVRFDFHKCSEFNRWNIFGYSGRLHGPVCLSFPCLSSLKRRRRRFFSYQKGIKTLGKSLAKKRYRNRILEKLNWLRRKIAFRNTLSHPTRKFFRMSAQGKATRGSLKRERRAVIVLLVSKKKYLHRLP